MARGALSRAGARSLREKLARRKRERLHFCIYCLGKAWDTDHAPWRVQARRAAVYAMNGVEVERPALFDSGERVNKYILGHKTDLHDVLAEDFAEFLFFDHTGISLAKSMRDIVEAFHHRQISIAGAADKYNYRAALAGEKKRAKIAQFQLRMLPAGGGR